MKMNYYKLILSFIFIIFFITGCAQPGKKVKGFEQIILGGKLQEDKNGRSL